MDCRLQYPKLQTVTSSNFLLNICHKARTAEEDTIIFDLSKTEFITPFGIILVAGAIAECLSSGKRARYRSPDKKTTRQFLSGIGFNKFFKLANGEHKIESPNVQLRRLGRVDYILTEQILEIFGYSLTMSDGIKGSLKMALNELMMNVFDHSQSPHGCYVCAQSYEQAQKIRLCIADFGIGILNSLRKNPELAQLDNDHGAITMAVKEGVTSRAGGYAGYGLSHINRFIKVNEGKMFILSGKGKVFWDFAKSSKSKKKEQTMRVPFQGTIVKLEINVDREGFYFLKSEEGNIF
jgi:anti-anti-sigma regulatory factor